MIQSRMKSLMNPSLPDCSLCHKNFDAYYHIPRVIPKCGHTFCEKCISSRLQSFKSTRRTFICPECQTDVIIRKSVADELPRNITIIDLSSTIRKSAVEYTECSQFVQECPQHHKAVDMVCLSCNQAKICSHCALFGMHKGHEITNQVVALQSDLKDLQEYMSIVSDSINAIMLPHSPQNIIRNSSQQLKSGLQKIIKINFKQYYQKIEKKEVALLQQCQQIDFNELYTNKSIDSVLMSFDNLKIKEENLLSSRDRQAQVTQREVEEFLAKAKHIHNQVQQICEDYSRKVSACLDRAMKKAAGCLIFKIQENPKAFSNVLEMLSDPADIESQSKQTKNRQKDIRSRDEPNKIQMPKTQHFISDQDLIVEVEPPYCKRQFLNTKKNADHNARKLSEQPKADKSQSVTSNDPQNSRVKVKNGTKHNQSSANVPYHKIGQSKDEHSKALATSMVTEKQIKKSRSTQQRGDKQTKSISKPHQNKKEDHGTLIDLTYEKPTKQLNYNLQSKYQDIIKQILRQQGTDSLELIGLQITDQLIPPICEFLLHKKLKFSMMKLVKNQIGDQGLKVLLSYLTVDKFTKVLNLTSNNLTNHSIDLLAKFVELNNILKSIYLSHNKISPMQLKRKRGIFEAKFVQVML